MFRRAFLITLILVLPTLLFGQSQFVGKWQNKRGRITGSVVVETDRIGGMVIFADFRGNLEMPISNARQTGKTLAFETKDRDDTFYWRLTLYRKTRGRLEGRMREMLFDERVKKRH